ncbi:thioredoxin [Fictibacillus sp. Mic-4]|uniref:thioredoxin n=1 Tax=Fictibacillus TaxID=1329200 RepID=UPI0004096E07|nr:thioredoxin [Fictibacillus gelatini]
MGLLHADGEGILKEIETSKTVLIDCWAPWCGPCRMINPILEEIHEELGVKIVKVNADDNEDFISRQQVLGIPTLLLFKDGQLVDRITGFRPKEQIIEFLKSHEVVEV